MLKNLKLVCKNFSKRYATVAKEKLVTNFLKEDVPPIEVLDVPYSKYGGETTVTLLTGSEVGKKGAEYIKTIFDHIQAPIELEYLTSEEVVPNEFLLSVMRNGTALYIDTSHTIENKQKCLLMNNQLDLYACVVNCFSIPGYACRFPSADITIVMQNNRGDFSKLEYEPVKGVVETLKVCDRQSIERYIDFAFKYACKHERKKITFGHKSSELPHSDGLLLDVATKLHKSKYSHIEMEDMFINKITKNLIMNPSHFDLLCLDDKYGTFITTVISGICGGASLFSAIEVGDHHAIFKPLQTKLSITGSAPLCSYGTVATAVSLLQHLGYDNCASGLWRGLMQIMVIDKIKTTQYGGECSEEDVISKLLDVLQESSCLHH